MTAPARTHAGSRRWVVVVIYAWAGLAGGLALAEVPRSTGDGRALVLVASVVFPLCAVAAAAALERQRRAVAIALLLLAVATPSYFFWPLNLVPLVIIAAVLTGRRRAR